MSENVRKILITGEIKAAELGDGGEMVISGWASTNGVDYANEVVEPQAFADSIEQYKRKGRLWYNHDHNLVLGKVLDIEIRDKGLYISKAVLADTAYNRDYIYPLIKAGGLNEFSIQFRSKKGEYRNGIYYHTKAELIETSVVSVACNPEADITGYKGLMSLEDWNDLIARGSKNDANTDDTETEQEPKDETIMEEAKNFTPDFSTMTVLEHNADKYDAEGKALDVNPSKSSTKYHDQCGMIYVAKRDNTYLFKVGVLTEKGFTYSFDSVALSFADAIGAKGKYFVDDATRLTLLKRFVEIYGLLGKQYPTVDGVPINEMVDDALLAMTFKSTEFYEGEKELVEAKLVKNAAEVIENYAKSQENKDATKNILKYLGASIDVNLWFYPNSIDDIEALNSILALLMDYYDLTPEDDTAEDDTETTGEMVMMSEDLVNAYTKFRDYINERLEQNEKMKVKQQEFDEAVKLLRAFKEESGE